MTRMQGQGGCKKQEDDEGAKRMMRRMMRGGGCKGQKWEKDGGNRMMLYRQEQGY